MAVTCVLMVAKADMWRDMSPMFFQWSRGHNPGVTKGSETAGEGRHAMRGALLTSFWTLLSRILGFARDAYMASIFGMSAAQGAFNLAWTFPNLFRRLFGEGAVSIVEV